jgi:hypothetical protein
VSLGTWAFGSEIYRRVRPEVHHLW